jgi:hypothetical protein
LLSFIVSEHVWSFMQSVRPGRHEVAQVPPEHAVAPVHGLPQPPQLAGSTLVGMHAPPQND